jgi:hypothetical protein
MERFESAQAWRGCRGFPAWHQLRFVWVAHGAAGFALGGRRPACWQVRARQGARAVRASAIVPLQRSRLRLHRHLRRRLRPRLRGSGSARGSSSRIRVAGSRSQTIRAAPTAGAHDDDDRTSSNAGIARPRKRARARSKRRLRLRRLLRRPRQPRRSRRRRRPAATPATCARRLRACARTGTGTAAVVAPAPAPAAPGRSADRDAVERDTVSAVASDNARQLATCEGTAELHGDVLSRSRLDAAGQGREDQLSSSIKNPEGRWLHPEGGPELEVPPSRRADPPRASTRSTISRVRSGADGPRPQLSAKSRQPRPDRARLHAQGDHPKAGHCDETASSRARS